MEFSKPKLRFEQIFPTFSKPRLSLAQRQSVLKHLHKFAHPGIRGSARLIAARDNCPKMKRNIKQWVNSSLNYQKANVIRNKNLTLANSSTIQVPDCPYEHSRIA